MQKLRLWIFFLVIFIAFSSLSGCSDRAIPLDYRQSDFEAEAILNDGAAELTVRIQKAADRIQMELLSPDSLSEITFCREAGEEYIICRELRLSADGFEHMLGWLDLLLPTGELILVGKSQINGCEVLGAVTESSETEIYLDKNTYAPLYIKQGERQISIKGFEFTN